MSHFKLEQLPNETLAQIASSCDATSALRLTATCRRIRAACYQSFVFRDILLQSQQTNWGSDLLDVRAIEYRCGKDAAAWARYAVADEMAFITSCSQSNKFLQPVTVDVLSWAAALFIVKHPFIYSDWWNTSQFFHKDIEPDAYTRNDVLSRSLWCHSVIALSHQADREYLDSQDHFIHAEEASSPGDSHTSYLHALCWTIFDIKQKRRNAPEPTGSADLPQYIPTPRIEALLSNLIQFSNFLPLPFSDGLDAWTSWESENSKLLAGLLTKGTWQGYYTYFRIPELDEPMINIQFEEGNFLNENHRVFAATGCTDGVGPFNVEGVFGGDNASLSQRSFVGTKSYVATHESNNIIQQWRWELKLTSFGLVGFWYDPDSDEKEGTVWLWKVT